MKGQRREMSGGGCKVKNAATSSKMGKTQARAIKNNVSSPKACGYKKVKNAVSG